MSWLRIDDGFTSHPKVAPLSDAAFRLHVTAMAYCSQHSTDGRIAADALVALPAVARGSALKRAIAELEKLRPGQEHPAWKAIDGGWEIHDFLVYNPSAATVKAEREAAKLRMQRVRAERVRENTDRTESEVRSTSRGGTGRVEAVSAETVPQDTVRARELQPWQPGAPIGDVESGALDPRFVGSVRAEFPGLCESNFRGAAVSLVWKRRARGTLSPRFLQPLDDVRTTDVSTVRLAMAADKYLKENVPDGPQAYSIAAFVAKLGHWLPREAKSRASPPSPVTLIPDPKPKRTPEEIAKVREIIANAPFMRRHVENIS